MRTTHCSKLRYITLSGWWCNSMPTPLELWCLILWGPNNLFPHTIAPLVSSSVTASEVCKPSSTNSLMLASSWSYGCEVVVNSEEPEKEGHALISTQYTYAPTIKNNSNRNTGIMVLWYDHLDYGVWQHNVNASILWNEQRTECSLCIYTK